MARVTGMKHAKTFLMTQRFSMKALTIDRCMSNLITSNQSKSIKESFTAEGELVTAVQAGCWVPHPRSGIYFPVGGDRVMDGVPDHASTFDRTFWLRDIDGIDDNDCTNCS